MKDDLTGKAKALSLSSVPSLTVLGRAAGVPGPCSLTQWPRKPPSVTLAAHTQCSVLVGGPLLVVSLMLLQ